MTVYLGSRCTIMLNSYDAIKEAFAKNAHVFSGRPQDLFFIKEITEGYGITSLVLWYKRRIAIEEAKCSSQNDSTKYIFCFRDCFCTRRFLEGTKTIFTNCAQGLRNREICH